MCQPHTRPIDSFRQCSNVRENFALNKLLDKLGVNPSNAEFDVVYVNGDHAVANMTLDGNDDGKVLKVRQIENEFVDRMFEDA